MILSDIIEYSNKVINGEIIGNDYLKKACKRFIEDINDDRYYFDEIAVNKVLTFLNSLELFNQENVKMFNLEDWQIFIISNIYGIKRKINNRRKYRYVYIEIPRKNGKSYLINSLAMYHLLFDEDDAQIVVSANSREQAKNVDFKQIKLFCNQIDRKKKYIKQYYNKVTFSSNEILVTASDAKKLDGLNASIAIVDELHAAPNSSMYDVLKSSQGERSEPLLMVITTAGFDVNSFCYQQRDYLISVLNKEVEDDNLFGVIFTLDKEDDYSNPDNFKKANPNLGISVQLDFIQAEVKKAVQNPIERLGVLAKNFNVWLNNKEDDEVYIESQYVNKVLKKFNLEEFIGITDRCYIGIDLSSTSDISALSVFFVADGRYYVKNHYYICENPSKTPKATINFYKQQAGEGNITITSGNVIDYDYILNDIVAIDSIIKVDSIFYDRWNSTQFIINLTNKGFYSIDYSQGNTSMNRPAKELQRLVLTENIVIDDNPITKMMFNNAIVYRFKFNSNIKIGKSKDVNKIDGVISIITVLGGFMELPVYGGVV